MCWDQLCGSGSALSFLSLLLLLLLLRRGDAGSIHEPFKVPDAPFSVGKETDDMSSVAGPLRVKDVPVSFAGRVVESKGDVEAWEEGGEP